MFKLMHCGRGKLGVMIFTSIVTLSLSYIVASASVTNDYDVNFRTAPKIDATNVICKLAKNDEVKILDVEGEWLKVEAGGVVGYINSNYVAEGSNATVNDNGVRVRTSATTQSGNIFAKFNKGTRVNVINTENDFYVIVKKGKKLYIHTSLVVLDEGVAFGTKELATETQVTAAETNAIMNNTNGTIIDNSVRVRDAANTKGNIVIRLNNNDRVKFVSKTANGWCSFLYNNNKVWVCGDYVRLDDGTVLQEEIVEEKLPQAAPVVTVAAAQDQTVVVNNGLNVGDIVYTAVSNLNFRNQMSLDSAAIIKKLPCGVKLKTIEIYEDWIKVTTEDGLEGYVSREYVSKTETQAQLLSYARTLLGSKYVGGGTSPSGFDCSGYTYYVFKHFGVNIPRSSQDQSNASNGYAVARTDLIPGDLVFFCTNGSSISHVGIYLGDNQFIHSQNSGLGVSISSLNEGYWNARYRKAVRIKM